MLTAQQLEYFKNKLFDERQNLTKRLTNNDSYGLDHAMNGSISELSGYDNHPGDLGSEMFERSKDLALREADSLELESIDSAIQRIEDRTYGQCIACGKSIDVERLEVIPSTDRCKSCQVDLEEHHYTEERPMEE